MSWKISSELTFTQMFLDGEPVNKSFLKTNIMQCCIISSLKMMTMSHVIIVTLWKWKEGVPGPKGASKRTCSVHTNNITLTLDTTHILVIIQCLRCTLSSLARLVACKCKALVLKKHNREALQSRCLQILVPWMDGVHATQCWKH